MIEFVNTFKNFIFFIFPSSGGTANVFELLSNGLVVLTLAWLFYSFIFFCIRGYKKKK